ncbi:MAG: hypothetical protein FJY76_00820 [Candidatus Aenigmarchaeota archaeon]|nr:hypothetical protein [Candidatus Aenigmarchaeota archaeon]
MVLSDRVYEILRRYRKSEVVLPEDENILYSFAGIGVATFGFRDVGGQPVETAWLTADGRSMLNREGIYRSRIRRMLHSLVNTLS